MKLLALLLAGAALQGQVIVPQVKGSLAGGDFNGARALLAQYRKTAGVTPEYLEALSWIGRADVAGKYYPQALANAAEVYSLAVQALAKRKFDAEPGVPTALGAAIEVKAQALAAQGNRAEAIALLEGEETRWRATSIRARIRKNLNLLNLEGKPAPPLETAVSVTGARPARAGRPVLLFFWAHWCADCKQEVAVIAQLQRQFGPLGLAVVAPTQPYGYVAGGVDASLAVETRYIRLIRGEYYAPLGNIEMPLSKENFGRYGVSTTPTLVLVDGSGIVRMYHPGAMTYADLAPRIAQLLSVAKR